MHREGPPEILRYMLSNFPNISKYLSQNLSQYFQKFILLVGSETWNESDWESGEDHWVDLTLSETHTKLPAVRADKDYPNGLTQCNVVS